MAKSEIFAGLDIGSTKVCTTVAEVHDDGRVDVIGVGLVPCSGLKRGIVVDVDATAKGIRESIETAQRASGAEIHTAIVGVTGEHIFWLNEHGQVTIEQGDHEVKKEHVNAVVEASRRIKIPQDKEIIYSVPRSFTVDGQTGIKDPVGMFGRKLEVETLITGGTSRFLENIVRSVSKAGVEIERLIPSAIASGLAVTSQEERDLGVAVIDIGGGTTDIAVFVNGEIYANAVLPVGGGHISHDIAVGLRTTEDEAERVKMNYGCASVGLVKEGQTISVAALGSSESKELPRHILAQLIEPRVEEIFELAHKQIDKTGYLGLLPMGIAIAGGSVTLPGIIDVATRVLETPSRAETPRGFGGAVNCVSGPEHATSVGLVMFAARERSKNGEEGGSSSLFGNVVTTIRKIFR